MKTAHYNAGRLTTVNNGKAIRTDNSLELKGCIISVKCDSYYD